MRRSIFALSLTLLFLTSCAPSSTPPTGPVPTPVQTQPPAPILSPTPEPEPTPNQEALDAYFASVAVPDFLDEAQQEQYRLAHYLYAHMFGGCTTAIEDMFPLIHIPFPDGGYTFESVSYEGMDGYYLSRYPYADFDATVRSVFTDRFWQERNWLSFGDEEFYPIYADLDGVLAVRDLGRGSGYYYNDHFPDEFRLEDQTEDRISFTLIGHYSPVWPYEGETYEERDQRLEREYEYTLEFPITMVFTDSGWRFDEFHTALADEDTPEHSPYYCG